MQRLLGSFIRWLVRHFVSLLVIVTILLAANFIQKEFKDLASLADMLSTLRSGKVDIGRYVELQKQALADRVATFNKDSAVALNSQIARVDDELRQKRTAKRPPLTRILSSLTGEGLVNDLKNDLAIALFEQEREYLSYLFAANQARAGLSACRAQLEQRRLRHVDAYHEYTNNTAEQASLRRQSPFKSQIPPFDEYRQMERLEARQHALYASNQTAHESYQQQRKVCEAMQAVDKVLQFEIRPERLDAVLEQLNQRIGELDSRYRANWLSNFSGPVLGVLPTALAILLSAMLVPLAIKTALYFVIAPLAARRPAVCLLPGISGALEVSEEWAGETPQRRKISAASQSISVDETEELLVHPEYLQSSSLYSEKATKFLLDWSYPITSLASGMAALTRIRATATEFFVISAAPDDPFGKVATLTIPAGAAFVFQPHGLVGVIQRRDQPLRITSHWRLLSLHAWLTLQLRFLAFHGPARLIVKGGRGVVLEKAGNGRSIAQAATLGFSANLAYSTTRCETFIAYLMGKQSLFNDHFADGAGYYAYEEMPTTGKKSGITGCPLEGVTDAILKVFGI